MKSIKKDLACLVVICGIISFLIYQAVGDIILTASVWVIYSLSLITGRLFEYLLKKNMPPLQVDLLVAWLVYFIICLSLSAIDFYYITPKINQFIDFPLPLSVSLLVWLPYGVILAIFTLLQYLAFTSCPECNGVTLRKGNYCTVCGHAVSRVERQNVFEEVKEVKEIKEEGKTSGV